MAKTILAIFNDRKLADSSINILSELGYDGKTLTVLMKDKKVVTTDEQKITAGTMSALPAGLAIGGVIGLLAGILTLVNPQLSILLFGNPVLTGLGLTGIFISVITGLVTGGITGALFGALSEVGVPELDAKVYEEYVRADGILLTVPVKQRQEQEVRTIVVKEGAINVKSLDLPEIKKEDKKIEKRPNTFFPRNFNFGRFIYG